MNRSRSNGRWVTAASDHDREQAPATTRTQADVASSEMREPFAPAARRPCAQGVAEERPGGLSWRSRCGGVQADVPNLVQAIGQDVLHEATEKFDGRERFGALAFGAESDRAVRDAEQAAIGDADAMGIATQVGQHVRAFFEGGFGVNIPRQPSDAPHQGAQALRVTKVFESRKGTVVVRATERGHHLAAKDLPQDVDREEKPSRGRLPTLAVETQSAGGDQSVDVRMELEFARPGMQDRRGADGRLEPASAHVQQRALRRLHQGIEDHAGRKGGERSKLGRQRKDDVEVSYVEHLLLTRLYPGLLGQRLTLGTMPIAARVVRRVLVPARLASV